MQISFNELMRFTDGTTKLSQPASTTVQAQVTGGKGSTSTAGWIRKTLLLALLWPVLVPGAPSTVLYVDLNSTNPTPPYADWSSAATNIQDAVDVASAGDLVLVSNGVYQTGGRVSLGVQTNRLAITKPLTVQSVNGPQATTIAGHQVPGATNGDSAVRCVYMTNGATLVGFTLSGGGTRGATGGVEANGGGVWCASLNEVVSNCVVISNSAAQRGGGAYFGTFNNCRFSNNSVLVGSDGGGAAKSSTLNNCVVVANRAPNGGGTHSAICTNCLFVGNSASQGCAAYAGTLVGCTMVGNAGDGVVRATLDNCIVYYNGLDAHNATQCTLNYCCFPASILSSGVGNTTNAPMFIDLAGGNYRLQTNSPCINSGSLTYVNGNSDLDGRPRVVGGGVDMGAFEFQGSGMGEFAGWLQSFGLATDGSADYADSDGDGMNNWHEWQAGTNPTNALSALKMYSPVYSNSATGVVVSWQSVSGINYYLQRGSSLRDLLSQPSASTIQSNILGQAGTTSFTDMTATNGNSFFYRVGVQF